MADPVTPAPRPARIWRIVLIISLALNLAVAGMVGGAMVSGRFGDGPPSRIDLGFVSRALTPEERRDIGRELRRDRTWQGQDFRSQMAAMAAALRAEPYDPAVMQTLLSEQAARMSQVQDRARVAVLDRIAAMSPERRRAFADRLEEELHRVRPPRETRSGG